MVERNHRSCIQYGRLQKLFSMSKLFFHERLNVQFLNDFTGVDGSYETLFVKATVPKVENLYVEGIYRPPNWSNVEFLSYMESVSQNLLDKQTVIMSDFNYNVLKVNDSTFSNYQNIFSRYIFVNEISLQTYASPGTSSTTSCLD